MRFLTNVVYCFVVVIFSGPVSATETEGLAALPCADVTIDYNSRQRWEPGQSPYGILYEAWTPEAFDELRERVVECSNPDAQSFVAYITYLQGINADVLQSLEDNRRQQALFAEEEAKREAELEAERALNRQLAAKEAERKRLADAEARKTADLEAERARKQAEEAERKRLAEGEARKKADLEAERAREQQQGAQEAERKRQAELEAPAIADDRGPQPKGTSIAAEPKPANPMFPLDEDVKIFVRNNPQLAQEVRTPAKDDLVVAEALFRNQAVVELALMLCNERWSDFPGQQEEASRRIDLLRRVYFQYLGLPLDKYHEFLESANQIFESTQATDLLLADLNSLYEICQQSLLEISYGFNFAQE